MSEGPECQQHYMPTTVSLTSPKPNYNIIFHNANGEEVGVLDFNGPGLSFEGNAEESAIVFMTWVGKMFSKRLDEEYKRGMADGRKQ